MQMLVEADERVFFSGTDGRNGIERRVSGEGTRGESKKDEALHGSDTESDGRFCPILAFACLSVSFLTRTMWGFR